MTFTDLAHTVVEDWPILVSGGALLVVSLAVAVFLMCRSGRRRTSPTDRDNERGKRTANRLTFLVAVVIGGLSARGMGHFFYDKLGFPLLIVVLGGGIFEITAFTCALRARLSIRDPEVGKAGADGIAVWVIAGLSGFFSAMDAGFNEVGLFQLVLPFLAAWLWERGMSIERRRIRGGSTVHLRLTPERILVWLRIAEPSGRTASEVDAYRRLTRVARAAAKVRSLRHAGGRKWRLGNAEKKLERATLSAVVHANLGNDPERREALASQVRFIFNALSLADFDPESPWAPPGDLSPRGDLCHMTGPLSGHGGSEELAGAQVTPSAGDPTSGQVTPESRGQATPLGSGQVTPQVTPASESPMPQGTLAKSSVKPPRSTGAAPRRTDKQLKAELQSLVAQHYRENPGVEINVKPLAKQLGIGRDRARRLLAEMNVRPIRKAANQ